MCACLQAELAVGLLSRLVPVWHELGPLHAQGLRAALFRSVGGSFVFPIWFGGLGWFDACMGKALVQGMCFRELAC